MKKIFSFCNQKGGVGKTTSVINISAVLARLGHKVLVIDMDSQANATSGLGHDKPEIQFTTYQLIVENINPVELVQKTGIENLSLIPSNSDLSGGELELINKDRREFVLKNQLEKIAPEYDFILIDCPPSLGLITINSLVSSDYVIIPLQCEYYALEGLGQLIHTIQLVQKNLSPSLDIGGVLLTMADFRTNLTQQVIEEVRGYFKDNVFETVIPRSIRLSEAPSFGKPAVIYDPNSRGSKSYLEAAKEFEKKFGSDSGRPGEESSKNFHEQAVNTMPEKEEQAIRANQEQKTEETPA